MKSFWFEKRLEVDLWPVTTAPGSDFPFRSCSGFEVSSIKYERKTERLLGASPFLTEARLTASLTVFFLGEISQLCLSERFSPTTGVVPRRTDFARVWRRKPADLY
jgi:hypothetical protein